MKRALSRSSHGGASRAFTLVEMLVVIAVITILASLLVAAVSRAQLAARVATCGSNLGQIYKAARVYANTYGHMLPDLFVALDIADHNKRYVNSHYARTEIDVTVTVPSGLWLLYTDKYAENKELFYCPEVPGYRRFGGSENDVKNGNPKMIGYAYNYFPDLVTGDESVAFPPDKLSLEETSNDVTQERHMDFYALMSDLFVNSDELPHWARRGMNVCHWDSSVKWVDLKAHGIQWNSQADTDGDGVNERIFTTDKAGATAVRDTWQIFSKARR